LEHLFPWNLGQVKKYIYSFRSFKISIYYRCKRKVWRREIRKNEKERLDFAIETYEKFVAGDLSKIGFLMGQLAET
jgi:hypothetical protein